MPRVLEVLGLEMVAVEGEKTLPVPWVSDSDSWSESAGMSTMLEIRAVTGETGESRRVGMRAGAGVRGLSTSVLICCQSSWTAIIAHSKGVFDIGLGDVGGRRAEEVENRLGVAFVRVKLVEAFNLEPGEHAGADSGRADRAEGIRRRDRRGEVGVKDVVLPDGGTCGVRQRSTV